MRSAIIDIGYNAIRAVVYEDNKIGSSELFSTKFRNDVLGLLSADSIHIKHQTYLIIEHITRAFKRLDVSDIKCVATAVLRDHSRSEEFVKKIHDEYNINVEIIDGEKEAHLTALGVVTGIQNCNGVVIDLGGGSLEIAEVFEKKIGKLASLALGCKVLASSNLDEHEIIDMIESDYGDNQYDTIYLVGGALRFIAKIYIELTRYPIDNLHNLEIPVGKFLKHLDILESSHYNNGKPYNVNKHAICVTRAIIEVFNPKNIIVSVYGLKEGVRISSMSNAEQKKDIVIEKVKNISNFCEKNTNFDSYIDLILPFTSGNEHLKSLVKLAIMIVGLNKNFDKTLKPCAIVEFVMSSEIPFTHKERIMLALILSYSLNHKPLASTIGLSKKLLSFEDANDSQIIGYLLHIAQEIDGPIFTSPSFSISQDNGFLEIQSDIMLPRHIFEKVCYRLKSIALARKTRHNKYMR